jgi:flavin-dependent thymidylate synthase
MGQTADGSSWSSLEVALAGYNGDVEVLRGGEGEFTPESISAAYARISRSSDPVGELRRQAREEVTKSRKSNRAIVFGLGHHSVAEHAVFNFDILGLSRLAIEALEWHRLCSFTEKSQRYITLDGDTVLPAELSPAERDGFAALIAEQNRIYFDLLPLLLERQTAINAEMAKTKRGRTVIEGLAKEDARYAVSLATAGQLGFTSNARNLELIIRRMRHAPLDEVRRLGEALFEQARGVAPSLIIMADEEAFAQAYGATLKDEYFSRGEADLRRAAAAVVFGEETAPSAESEGCAGGVTLAGHTADPDGAVLTGLLFSTGRGSLAACAGAVARLDLAQRHTLFRESLAHLSEYDSPPRAFEEARFHFELTLDASAMAQLKRHRMSTQLWGPYDPALGVTVPPEVEAVNRRDQLLELVGRTEEGWAGLRQSLARRGQPVEAADYVLTNAHRRRVSLTMNLRELYHFSRLREDAHAQWAIRDLAERMSAQVRRAAPVTAALLGGKDTYARVFGGVMERPAGEPPGDEGASDPGFAT